MNQRAKCGLSALGGRFQQAHCFNLSRPEKSLFLLAPLAETSAGWGLCCNRRTKEKVTVFATTADSDYQKLLTLCRAGQRRLETIKRFDMPGFIPRADWVREMRRYGVLPQLGEPASPIDVYATERAYWQSLWYQPTSQ